MTFKFGLLQLILTFIASSAYSGPFYGSSHQEQKEMRQKLLEILPGKYVGKFGCYAQVKIYENNLILRLGDLNIYADLSKKSDERDLTEMGAGQNTFEPLIDLGRCHYNSGGPFHVRIHSEGGIETYTLTCGTRFYPIRVNVSLSVDVTSKMLRSFTRKQYAAPFSFSNFFGWQRRFDQDPTICDSLELSSRS